MILVLLWIAPVITALIQYPVWITVSFMAFFAIYAGHEWTHVVVASMNGMEITEISLSNAGNTHTLFMEAEEGPGKGKAEADVYLAGVVWDSVFFAISILSSTFYFYYYHDQTPLTFAGSLIMLLIFNLAVPGSDWREYRKRTTMRV